MGEAYDIYRLNKKGLLSLGDLLLNFYWFAASILSTYLFNEPM